MTEALAPEPGPPPVDPRPRQLLEKYASLVGTMVLDTGPGLVELEIPSSERRHWGSESTVTIALTPEALAEDPDAELLGIGSPVFERLIAAIRARGFHDEIGIVAPSHDPAGASEELPAPLERATLEGARSDLSLVPIGRLLARVSIKAGAVLEEQLVESPPIDLSTGVRAPSALASVLPTERISGPAVGIPAEAVAVPRMAMDRLLPLAFDELEAELREDLAKVGLEAEAGLRRELERLDRYYEALLAEIESEGAADASAAQRSVQADHARRRGEEEERFRTRITVHPLQLVEWRVPAQRVTWKLRSPEGVDADLSATRLLTGDTEWRITCPGCGTRPSAVTVCRDGHAVCTSCGSRCGVCAQVSCAAHGRSECAPGTHAVCADHALVCRPCGRTHCEQHARHCSAADHDVCPDCAVTCASCGVDLCRAHAIQTGVDAPRGQRWLCDRCVVLCEGGSDEPVGRDETVRCVSCERHVCDRHRVVCAVDGRVHCSRHLRKSDRSGRLVCEEHRAECREEPGSIMASDEVRSCASCGKDVCDVHGGECVEDAERHCVSHLSSLADLPGRRACEQHRTVCHVDGVAFSLTGTRACAVCGKLACEKHRVGCPSCGRQVCSRDHDGKICGSCSRLDVTVDPSDDLIQAALAANGGKPPKAKRWRTARDATGTVVELDFGWTRRLVFSVLHGDLKPRTVVQHSLLGAKRLR